MTKISFIVVAYNAAQSLDALLGDLLAQTVDPRQLEALLVDSASTDRYRGKSCAALPSARRSR